MALQRFNQLEVWQESHQLTLDVYAATRSFPAEERYGLVSQMRRAAYSIPANIAEGFKRRTKPDKIHRYNIAQASLEELRYYLILTRDLKISLSYDPLEEKAERVSKMLDSLVRAIEHSQ